VADDVADEHRHAPVVELDCVVPVAADRRATCRGQVAAVDRQPVDLWQALRQQAALQRRCHLVVVLVGTRQALLHLLALVDVGRRADVALEPAADEARQAPVDDPAIGAVATAQAILALPGLTPVEGLPPALPEAVGIVGVHSDGPRVPELLLLVATGELQPAAVDEVDEPRGVARPDEDRRAVSELAEAALRLRHALQRLAQPLPLASRAASPSPR
jgi:hypothetical protein